MIEIPPGKLPPETLDGVIEAFVLREGTDYGESEVPLAEKIAQVRRQITEGEIVIVYDETLETTNLLTRREYARVRDH